jgi:hypothetical protein
VVEYLAVFGDNPNVEIGHQNDDAASSVATAESDVVQALSVAQGDGAGIVDAVVTHAGFGEERLAREHGDALSSARQVR